MLSSFSYGEWKSRKSIEEGLQEKASRWEINMPKEQEC